MKYKTALKELLYIMIGVGLILIIFYCIITESFTNDDIPDYLKEFPGIPLSYYTLIKDIKEKRDKFPEKFKNSAPFVILQHLDEMPNEIVPEIFKKTNSLEFYPELKKAFEQTLPYTLREIPQDNPSEEIKNLPNEFKYLFLWNI